MTDTHYDILIVGGGLVGVSMAVALKPLGLKVGLIDAFRFDTQAAVQEDQSAYDDRSIALSYGSSLIYQGMGIWEQLAARFERIEYIHVSDQGRLGATRLSAKKEKVPALGYVIESRLLGKALYDALQDSPINIIAPAKVTQLHQVDDGNEVTLDQEGVIQSLHCKLLIASDGAQSPIRKQRGIPCKRTDYKQTAVIANVGTDRPHNNWAYERFTKNGPLALLPLPPQNGEQRLSLVWTQKTPDAPAIMALPDRNFLAKLQEAFGYRLGKFTKVGKRSCFPLHLLKSERDICQRLVLIGNASHSLHPVAGQGLNLGLRDVAVLADQLAKSKTDCGNADLLRQYQQSRKPDYDSVVNYTDALIHLFSNNFAPLGHLRAGGLMAIDRIPPLRKLLAESSMGLKHRQSRLARGLSLT